MENTQNNKPENSVISKGEIKSAQFEAIVIRADGTVENLGVISFYHRNPLIRLWWNLKKLALNIYKRFNRERK